MNLGAVVSCVAKDVRSSSAQVMYLSRSEVSCTSLARLSCLARNRLMAFTLEANGFVHLGKDGRGYHVLVDNDPVCRDPGDAGS